MREVTCFTSHIFISRTNRHVQLLYTHIHTHKVTKSFRKRLCQSNASLFIEETCRENVLSAKGAKQSSLSVCVCECEWVSMCVRNKGTGSIYHCVSVWLSLKQATPSHHVPASYLCLVMWWGSAIWKQHRREAGKADLAHSLYQLRS